MYVLTAFIEGSGETEMDIRETRSEESGVRQGRKKRGVYEREGSEAKKGGALSVVVSFHVYYVDMLG